MSSGITYITTLDLNGLADFMAARAGDHKGATLISMGWLFHRWNSDMNRKYVKKQLVPKHMGKIT
jgi:hypothetical protein